jgi:hypothetical protein
LIIKGLDNQVQGSTHVCLMIKSLDTQAQKLNDQINQYPEKRLILTLASDVLEAARGSAGLVKSDLRGNLLGTTLVDMMWVQQAP